MGGGEDFWDTRYITLYLEEIYLYAVIEMDKYSVEFNNKTVTNLFDYY